MPAVRRRCRVAGTVDDVDQQGPAGRRIVAGIGVCEVLDQGLDRCSGGAGVEGDAQRVAVAPRERADAVPP